MFGKRPGSRGYDADYGFSNIGSALDSDDDFKKMKDDEELAKLMSEFGDPPPKTPMVNPFPQIEAEEEGVIQTLTTKGSRRKRTIGAADRPNTAPMKKKEEFQGSTIEFMPGKLKDPSQTTGSGAFPFARESGQSTGFQIEPISVGNSNNNRNPYYPAFPIGNSNSVFGSATMQAAPGNAINPEFNKLSTPPLPNMNFGLSANDPQGFSLNSGAFTSPLPLPVPPINPQGYSINSISPGIQQGFSLNSGNLTSPNLPIPSGKNISPFMPGSSDPFSSNYAEPQNSGNFPTPILANPNTNNLPLFEQKTSPNLHPESFDYNPPGMSTGFNNFLPRESGMSSFAIPKNNPLKIQELNSEVKEVKLSPRSLEIKRLEQILAEANEQRAKELDDQKTRFDNALKQELEKVDQEHEQQLSELKNWFESKKSSLENFRSHHDTISNLAQLISKHSQTINTLSSKFSKEKEYTEDIKIQELSAKERALEEREKRLLTQIQIIEQDKKRLELKQKTLEDLEDRFQKIIDEDKYKLIEEQKSMTELQETLRLQDREKKQILALEMHKLSLLEEQVEREEKIIEEEISNKENDIKEKEALMEIEKNEAYTQIQYEKNLLQSQITQIENFRRNIPNINADINKRVLICEEKSKQLKYEAENLRKAQEMLEKDRKSFEKEAQKIHQICIDLDKETESLMEQRQEIERRRREIEQRRHEVLEIKEKSRQDRHRVDQLKMSLAQRKKVYESLKGNDAPFEKPPLGADRSYVRPKRFQNVSFDGYRSDKPSPKLGTGLDSVYFEPEPMRNTVRPRSVISRSTFKAADYLKDLEQYHHGNQDTQNYIAEEAINLMKSKMNFQI
ncbi:hypothetical protein SteCoe_3904 [Stentor coeruleus]|uniref:Uncharacterized protein n=1 Tax=Stentor coeruleus TaxID=5963 RepID=A0A1R2CW16_9CILI|nr:hypothetical protein SteCoe_3904 [Stentor coeruleus]